MDPPTDVAEGRRILGMVNQLSKFLLNLANITNPLRKLLQKESLWCWDIAQQQAFVNIQGSLSSLPVLSFYDPNRETVVAADSSSYELGAVLMQKVQGVLKPICFYA